MNSLAMTEIRYIFFFFTQIDKRSGSEQSNLNVVFLFFTGFLPPRKQEMTPTWLNTTAANPPNFSQNTVSLALFVLYYCKVENFLSFFQTNFDGKADDSINTSKQTFVFILMFPEGIPWPLWWLKNLNGHFKTKSGTNAVDFISYWVTA